MTKSGDFKIVGGLIVGVDRNKVFFGQQLNGLGNGPYMALVRDTLYKGSLRNHQPHGLATSISPDGTKKQSLYYNGKFVKTV